MTNILDKEIQAIAAEWQAIKPSLVSGLKVSFKVACDFMLKALDVFVVAVEPALLSGADKKAAVLAAIAVTYDTIVAPFIPFYLKPANSAIKAFVVAVVASAVVDFVVSQYNKFGGIPTK
jgi:hypothetical protein